MILKIELRYFEKLLYIKIKHVYIFKGELHPNQKLANFVLYLKIINFKKKKIIYIYVS